jgi:hypothetical protein
LGCVWDCDFVEKMCDLNQITENEPFGNCVFKKLRFENAEKYLFKSQAMGSVWVYDFKNSDLKMCDFKKLFLKTLLSVWQNRSLTFKIAG